MLGRQLTGNDTAVATVSGANDRFNLAVPTTWDSLESGFPQAMRTQDL